VKNSNQDWVLSFFRLRVIQLPDQLSLDNFSYRPAYAYDFKDCKSEFAFELEYQIDWYYASGDEGT